MNNDFEQRLQRQPERKIPGGWRAEVLARAQAAATSVQTPPPARPSWLQLFQALLSRPQRVAWAGLVGVWLMILAMNVAARDNTHTLGPGASLPTPETWQALKQQKRLLAELVDHPAADGTGRAKAIPAGPHSRRREETLTA